MGSIREKEVLESWKEISEYLKHDVKTCRRWEQELGLPIRRLDNTPKARVFAYKNELDSWLENKLTINGLEKELFSDPNSNKKDFPPAEHDIPKRKTPDIIESTRKLTLKKFIFPVISLIVFIAAILFIRKPFSEKTPTPTPTIQNSIAVISFENLTGDSQYDSLVKAVPSLFITKFEAMGFSYVATWERLQDLLKQLGKDPSKPIDTETGFEVCRKEGIAALVVGKITKAGEVFATDIKVLDAATKKSLTSATSHGQGEDSILLSQIDELSSRIAQNLGGTLSAEEVPPISEFTTFSMQAYEHYLKGQEDLKKFYWSQARQHFLKAVKIDPDFVSAHLGIAYTYFQQGNSKARNESMKKVILLSEKANPKERLYIKAYSFLYLEEDAEKTARIMEEIIKKYPKEKEARWRLGLYYKHHNKQDEAISQFQTVLALDPHYAKAFNEIAGIYMGKRDIENALIYADRYVAADPNSPNPLDSLALIYLVRGRLDLALEKSKQALAIKPDFYFALNRMVNIYGQKENYSEAIRWAEEKISRSSVPLNKADGYLLKAFFEYWTGSYQKAVEDAETSREIIEDPENNIIPFWSFILEGFAYLEQENFNRSRENFIKSYEISLKMLPAASFMNKSVKEYFLGVIELKQKKIRNTHKILEKIQRMLLESKDLNEKEYIEFILNLLRREVFIAEESVDEDMSVFEKLPFSYIAGRHWNTFKGDDLAALNLLQPEILNARLYEIKGDLDKAIDILEKLPDLDLYDESYSEGYLRLIPPKVYYHLGRLYEKKGLKQKAKENYSKFLELFKNADPGIAEVEDARKRFSVL